MSSKKLLILAIFFLSLSLILDIFLTPKTNKKSYSHSFEILQILPERLRAFIAARLWEKADYLMHKGPVISGQSFVAGSYAGNTDIIPYLKMVIALCPDETAPYRLLASNYAYHLGMKKDALILLEDAFYNCENSKHLHELYASAAFIHLFIIDSKDSENSNNDLQKAEKYINKAISIFNESAILPDPVFRLNNYYIVKARILWELGKPDQALNAWLLNDENKLETSNDKLAKNLLNYKQTGTYEPLKSFETTESDCYFTKQESCEVCKSVINNEQSSVDRHEHSHELNQKTVFEHEKSLLKALIWYSLKAGFVLLIVILLYFRGSESYGTASSSILFFAGK